MSELVLEHITKRFQEVVAVDDVTLTVRSGEFLFLVGPSGCGKTTILRMIAGLEDPSSGKLLIDGKDGQDLPAEERNVGYVFQSYALWPHLTVFENVAFGLNVRKLSKETIRSRVQETLDSMKIGALADRYPAQLSGGQQQRTALARALVIQPRILLFDEPLSNLDAQLREELREELRRIHQQYKITSVYVTHDLTDALYLADRIAVIDKGKLLALDTPRIVLSEQSTGRVREICGQIVLFRGTVTDRTQGTVSTPVGPLHVRGVSESSKPHVMFALRPEGVVLLREE